MKTDDAMEQLRKEEQKHQEKKFIVSLLLSIPLLWTMVTHFSFTSFCGFQRFFKSRFSTYFDDSHSICNRMAIL